MQQLSYRRHRFPPLIIQHAVWLYLRFTLSYRDVEELLAERGIDVSNETIRRWVLKFGRGSGGAGNTGEAEDGNPATPQRRGPPLATPIGWSTSAGDQASTASSLAKMYEVGGPRR